VVVRRAARTTGTAAVALALALVTAGCSHASSAPPQVTALFAGDKLSLDPTQYCDGSTLHRYDVRPPVVSAGPDTRVTFSVPDAVAARGWSVQVFDQNLKEKLGTVDVPRGKALFDQISTSDVVPAAFYLVVVENETKACHRVSGAWPVGVIRTTKVPSTATPATATSSPSSSSQG
jgi:glucose/arabinose dehydrogenase